METKEGETYVRYEKNNDIEERAFTTEGEITDVELDDLISLLKETLDEHETDANFPQEMLNEAREFLAKGPKEITNNEAQALLQDIRKQRDLLLNDSPYPEVRAVVDPVDDPSISANTFRAWFIGMLLTIVFTGVNQLFTLRYPYIFLSSYVSQVISYPMGTFLAKVLPSRQFSLLGWRFSLNPGPFNQKEHMLITVMANVGYGGYLGTAYTTNIFTVLKVKKWYNDQTLYNKAGFQILLTLSTQLLGYGCAGLARRFLVYPSTMIYPKALSTIALNKALHNDQKGEIVHGWSISRYRFFLYSFGAMFVWYWFPGYLFQATSYFNWMTWIAPENVTLAAVTGSITGLGLNPWPTFDWNIASVLYDPIITPYYALVTITVGTTFFCVCVIIPLWWANIWKSGYFPIMSNSLFDKTGAEYDVSKIMINGSFSAEAYEAYSPPYMTASYATMFFCFFGSYMAAVVHIILYNRHELRKGFSAMWKWQNARDEYEDVHNRLMKTYKEVPEWWYLTILAFSFVVGCITAKVYDTGFPIWGMVVGVLLCLILQVPYGMVYAITNAEVTNNVIAELIAGYAIPNQPIANMIFKTYGVVSCAQSIQFVSDLKMGHYMKIAPRVMFSAQIIATIVAAFVSIGVNAWALANIEGVCETGQAAGFNCENITTFFTSSVLWGAIGPRRLFASGQMYNATLYGFLMGLLLPVPFYLASKYFPKSGFRYIYSPLLLYGMINFAPYNLTFCVAPLIVGTVFNFYIKRHYLAWWEKYAYVLTSSFGAALAISAVVIFFAVEYHTVDVNWWGNSVSYAGCDDAGCTLKAIPASGIPS
ncbi:OPT oligopeptide transporter [Penicillium atrosanguineum]|uniref:OPT oligopeptide transporter n=1 Tax=Penicillium atrosanguineum TaxID=1132637 RepID=A0A9W9QCF2_9EURO|nr:OPT oligopeptide transporter [Penicillium atrosanguineum]KAJ5147557.1 OPT oligopeptide transporter [Penicillium atrosanguineum]KAJ5331136.1 OPT oligopeptide transporter [Penicillium atrosanguineum]